MAVSGFPIIAEVDGDFETFQPWFGSTVSGTYSAINQELPEDTSELVANDTGSLADGDLLYVKSNDDVPFDGSVTTVAVNVQPAQDHILTTLPFTTFNDTGIWSNFQWLLWDSDTPETILREIQVQYTTELASIVQVTIDGNNWANLNNGIATIGLATFTMFVLKDSKLNFRYSSGAGETDIVVSAAR